MVAGITAAALGAASLALAQTGWTTVTKDDLAICAPIFTEVQRIEQDWLSRVGASCDPAAAHAEGSDCATYVRRADVSRQNGPLDWFFAGNDVCEEGGDYPCFGPGVFNTPRSGREATVWTTTFTQDAATPARVTPDMTLAQAAFEGDRCIAQVWVKKNRDRAAPPLATAVAATATTPARDSDLAGCLDDGPSSPDRIAKCDAVIGRMQPGEQDYGSLAVALMQMNADAGKPVDALRYGDLVAIGKPEADAAMTRCAVRVIVKWDLDAGMAACKAAGEDHAPALEAAGQIHMLAGRWQDGWNAFDAAYKVSGAGQPLYLRGVAAAALGRMGEGLKDMADGEAKAPGSAQAYDRDGYSIAAVTKGKPLAPPEAFAPLGGAPAPASQPAPPEPEAVSVAPAPPPPAAPGRFDPDGPRPAMLPLGPAQLQACEDDVRGWQAASTGWQGTIDEISLKLGMLQRTLYASRCASHPQAAAFIASADRLIADTGPRAETAQTTAEQTSPAATDCLEPVPLGALGNTGPTSVFRNTCTFPVMAAYCNIAPASGSWAETFACETRGSIAMVAVPANGTAPAVFGRQINHLACKQPALPVASYTPASGLAGYCK